MAMPRKASAGASSRRATRFSAPSRSPAASARAAAVISASIQFRQKWVMDGALSAQSRKPPAQAGAGQASAAIRVDVELA